MGQEVSRLAQGEFNPHRQGISSADPSTPITNSKEGVNGKDNEILIADVALKSGTLTSAQLEVLTYSEDGGQFVPQVPAAQYNLTGPGQFVFASLYGRRFFIKVNTLVGANPLIDINVSVFRRNAVEFV